MGHNLPEAISPPQQCAALELTALIATNGASTGDWRQTAAVEVIRLDLHRVVTPSGQSCDAVVVDAYG